MKKHILLGLIIVFLLSCTKTIDFDDEGYAKQLVLNSIIWPDSVFTASLTQSTSILKNDLEIENNIPDGTLDLYENDLLLAHLTSSSGGFHAQGIKPKAGNTYRVVATSGGRQIQAETTIPLQAEVVSIDTSWVKDQYGSNTMNFNIKINDAPGEDYYRIILRYEYLAMYKYTDTNNEVKRTYYLYNNNRGIETDDPVFKTVFNNSGEEIFDMGPENKYDIFPDDLFEGKVHSIQVKNTLYHTAYEPYNPSIPGYVNIYDRFTIHVQRLSKDLYNYFKYLELYKYYHDNPISEPVPVYSNISNGAGIFAGFNDNARFTFEKTYIPYSMDTIKIEENPTGGYGGGGGYGSFEQ